MGYGAERSGPQGVDFETQKRRRSTSRSPASAPIRQARCDRSTAKRRHRGPERMPRRQWRTPLGRRDERSPRRPLAHRGRLYCSQTRSFFTHVPPLWPWVERAFEAAEATPTLEPESPAPCSVAGECAGAGARVPAALRVHPATAPEARAARLALAGWPAIRRSRNRQRLALRSPSATRVAASATASRRPTPRARQRRSSRSWLDAVGASSAPAVERIGASRWRTRRRSGDGWSGRRRPNRRARLVRRFGKVVVRTTTADALAVGADVEAIGVTAGGVGGSTSSPEPTVLGRGGLRRAFAAGLSPAHLCEKTIQKTARQRSHRECRDQDARARARLCGLGATKSVTVCLSPACGVMLRCVLSAGRPRPARRGAPERCAVREYTRHERRRRPGVESRKSA